MPIQCPRPIRKIHQIELTSRGVKCVYCPSPSRTRSLILLTGTG